MLKESLKSKYTVKPAYLEHTWAGTKCSVYRGVPIIKIDIKNAILFNSN